MKISFVNGVRRGEELLLAMPEITVGSVAGNTVVIDAPAVSGHHAVLQRGDDGRWTITDRNSTNGIRINGEMIGGVACLEDGDEICFGDQVVRLTELHVAAPKIVFKEDAPPPVPVAAEKPAPGQPDPASAPPPATPAVAAAAMPDPEAIRNGSVDIFKNNQDLRAPGRPGGSRLSNRLFYTILACLILCGVSAIVSWQNSSDRPAGGERDPEVEAKQFLLYYEKSVLQPDNAFRFELRVEDGNAHFTIDDLKSRRKFTREVTKISLSHIEQLRNAVERAHFFQLKSPEPGTAAADRAEKRRLVAGEAGKIHEVRVVNNLAPEAFEQMERAIDAFAEEYGLQTIAMTPAELQELAAASFSSAEDLFSNREAELSNLRMAIRRYQMVLDYLEQFSPKPELYVRARARLEEATRIRQSRLQELKLERQSMARMKQFDQVRHTLRQIMELCDPDSDDYERARTQLFEVDRYLNQRRKR
ncbi:MAG: FHA domain-containing protein [Lentisphaeria bacterium]|nr:FHA domain-containing protein [Lentisphaeria bacterium]